MVISTAVSSKTRVRFPLRTFAADQFFPASKTLNEKEEHAGSATTHVVELPHPTTLGPWGTTPGSPLQTQLSEGIRTLVFDETAVLVTN